MKSDCSWGQLFRSQVVDRNNTVGYSCAMRMLVLSTLLLLFSYPALAANSARKFGGVGIDGAPWADGRIVVKQLVSGGPAHLAGIRVGDVITHIDGKPTEGSNFQEMVDYRLRGVDGSPVTIKIRRPGSPKILTFNLTRRQLVIPPKSR